MSDRIGNKKQRRRKKLKGTQKTNKQDGKVANREDKMNIGSTVKLSKKRG